MVDWGGVIVPAERWLGITKAYSAQIAGEHRGGKPIPVRTATYNGFLYTVFSIVHGQYGPKPPRIEAYRLLPPSQYTGETTLVYHDEKAIQVGLRERGDHAGLIVSVNGKSMVCAQRVWFVLGLPGTRPLSLAEAVDYDSSQRRFGWRALWFSGKEPAWFSLRGHPVAVYHDRATFHDDHAVMLWKANGEILELSIDGSVSLSPPEELQTAPSVAATTEGQLVLL